ncbi:MAG: S9 family peptidase [Ignavibacteriales bacterium]|nr:S9 family peptidase [Ignavibacteriales bacterium]
MKQLLFLICVVPLFLVSQPKRAITFDDLIGMGRVSDPRVSPDGQWIAFVITYHNKVENKTNSNIYLVSVNGGEAKQLTSAKGSNNSPRWMPDGKSIAFVSTRDGEAQIWSIPVSGGEAKKVSALSTGVAGLVVSPAGNWFAFNSEVYPDCPDDDCNQKKNEEVEKSKVRAKLFDRLPYRIWNSWKDGKRSHLFVMPTTGGKATDVTPGDFDTPPIDLGGNWDYAFSPDSKELAFSRNPDNMVAISTNNEMYTVPAAGGTPKKITENPANDSQPLYSPDGKYIAYRAMKRAGFEADQNQLVLYERSSGKLTNLTEAVDYSVNDVVWSPDSKSLIFNADDKGNESIFRITVSDKKVQTLLNKGYNHSLRLSPDGKTLVFIREAIHKPAEIYKMDIQRADIRKITSINDERAQQLDMSPLEDFWFEGTEGAKVHGWIVKPPSFSAAKKYPMVYLIHGGPQGQWGDQFHYRWSAQMFASRGYVVAMVNPRGSTGYGHKFTDEITGDWGGKVYDDLMKGVDYILKTYAFVDGNRLAAAGASYGGYMVNWIAGHTDRFKCLVNHDGVYNPSSMYGTTEELWFVEWEYKGTPYQNPELYKKWSPLEYASRFKTPMLVVHGQQDFRVDVSEGFQVFTALQRQGVKSKMLYFPDEGHWVMKPANAELWYKTVLDWIDENTK